jgi:hypothetical protein
VSNAEDESICIAAVRSSWPVLLLWQFSLRAELGLKMVGLQLLLRHLYCCWLQAMLGPRDGLHAVARDRQHRWSSTTAACSRCGNTDNWQT